MSTPVRVNGQGKAPPAEDVVDQQDGHGFDYIIRGGETLDPLGEGTGDGEEVLVTPLRILGWGRSSLLVGWTRERKFPSSVEELDVGVVMAEIGSRLNNLLHTR